MWNTVSHSFRNSETLEAINPFKHFKFKQIGSQIQFSDYLLPSTSYCLERRNQTIWLTAEVINRSIIIRCRPSLTQSAFRERRDRGERTEPMRTDCSSACWVYLRVSIKSDQLLLWVQQFTGIGNVDGKSLVYLQSAPRSGDLLSSEMRWSRELHPEVCPQYLLLLFEKTDRNI